MTKNFLSKMFLFSGLSLISLSLLASISGCDQVLKTLGMSKDPNSIVATGKTLKDISPFITYAPTAIICAAIGSILTFVGLSKGGKEKS